MEQVRVALQATDPLSLAGLTQYLEARAEVTVVRTEQRASADVLVVAADRLTADVVAALRRAAAEAGTPVVLITNEITEAELLTAVECRVVAILPRPAVTGERLLHSVMAAAGGGGVMPPNLVGELLKHIERLQRDVLTPYGLNASGLTPREVDVLRLMADGLANPQIAARLYIGVGTVKTHVNRLFAKLGATSRTQAVARARALHFLPD